VRLGVLSTARIARSFVQGVQPSRLVQVTAVASRELSKAQQFAESEAIPRALGSYEALLADPDIDAIYNPLPNGLHAEWSRRAMLAGKHVLCEKPLCATASEARDLFALARKQGVRLVEGFPYRAQPQTQKLREMIAAGAIGELKLIQANFSFTLKDAGNVRWDPKLEGGALMDIGTYCVSLIRMLSGSLPVRVHALAQWSEPNAGVDRSLVGTLEFASGLYAQLTCSFDAALNRQALIVGSTGTLQTTFLNHTSAQMPGELKWRQGPDSRAPDSVVQTSSLNGFLGEAESFARMVSEGAHQWVGATPEESIDIATIIEALLQSARAGRAVDVS
jgi:D-xylose 1-dehydrogenase (NADP+, D-xylono-1,5-lactone-forming)